MDRERSLRWVRVLVTNLLVIAVPFAIYFLVFQAGRLDYFHGRNMRALDGIAREFVGRLENIENVLTYKARSLQRLREREPESWGEWGKDWEAYRTAYREATGKVALQTDAGTLLLDFSPEPRGGVRWPTHPDEVHLWTDSPGHAARIGVRIQEQVKAKTETGSSEIRWLQLEDFELRHLLPPALAGSLFQDLLLVREDGEVIFGFESTDTRFTDLSHLIRRSERARARAAGEEKGAPITPPNDAGASREPVFPGSSALFEAVEIAGRSFDLYSVPVRLAWTVHDSEPARPSENGAPAVAAAGMTTWYLCGIVPTHQTRAEVRSISPTVLASLIFFLVVGSLAWPYLKVWYISHREQLHASDFLFLLLSTLLGAALVTLLVLDAFTYRSIHASYDRALQAVGARIDEALLAEVEQANRDLTCLSTAFRDRGRWESSRPGKPRTGRLECGADSLLDSRTVVCLDEDANQCWVEIGAETAYPPFELGFWLDEKGKEVGQWNTRHRFLGTLEVPDREYFRAALDKDLWQLQLPDGPGVFTTRILARDQGELLSILSVPALSGTGADPDDPTKRPARVAVLGKRLSSLWKPALPGSFGIAVIDHEGRVLYHSDEHRSLIENLFVETKNDRHLRAATAARREVLLPVDYQGHEHRFYVRPLKAAPWTLIVFWDQRFAQTTNFELLMTCALGMLIYTSLLLVGALVVRAFSPPFRFTFLWPRWRLRSAYLQSTCALFVLALLYLLCALSLSPQRFLALATVMPIFTLVFLFARLREPIRVERRHRIAAYLMLVVTGNAITFLALDPSVELFWARALAVFLAALGVCWAFSAHWGRALSSRFRERARPEVADRLDAIVEKVGGRVWRDDRRTGATPTFVFSYVSLLLLVVTVLSVIPAVGIYRDALPVYWRPFVRFVELEYVRALHERVKAFDRDVARIAPHREGEQHELDGAGDVPAHAPAPLPSAHAATFAPYDFGLRRARDRLDDAPGWPRLEQATACEPVECEAPGCIRPREALWREVVDENLSAGVAAYLPVYNTASSALRDLLAPQASDESWCWVARPSGQPEQTEPDEVLRYQRAWPTTPLGVAARQIGFRNPPTADAQARAEDERREWLFAGGVLLILVGAFALLRSLGERVFGLRLPSFPLADPGPVDADRLRGHSLLLRPGPDVVAALAEQATWVVDLRERSILPLTLPAGIDAGDSVLLLHFECRLLNPAWTRSKLQLLEDLVFLRKLENVVIVSNVDILNWLSVSLEEAAIVGSLPVDPLASISPESLARWSAVLASFERIRFPAPGWVPIEASDARYPEPGLVQRWKVEELRREAILQRETDWLHELVRVADEVRGLPGFAEDELTEEQIVQQVADRAEAVYRELWSYLTFKERQALVHLAKGDLINPRNVDVIRRLMRKGLVHRDPHFRLASRSLRYFVLRAESRERVQAWEAAAGSGLWKNLSTPLLVALGLVAGFLFYTNRDFFDAATGFVAAALAGLPLIFQMLNVFSRGGSSSPPTSD